MKKTCFWSHGYLPVLHLETLENDKRGLSSHSGDPGDTFFWQARVTCAGAPLFNDLLLAHCSNSGFPGWVCYSLCGASDNRDSQGLKTVTRIDEIQFNPNNRKKWSHLLRGAGTPHGSLGSCSCSSCLSSSHPLGSCSFPGFCFCSLTSFSHCGSSSACCSPCSVTFPGFQSCSSSSPSPPPPPHPSPSPPPTPPHAPCLLLLLTVISTCPSITTPTPAGLGGALGCCCSGGCGEVPRRHNKQPDFHISSI